MGKCIAYRVTKLARGPGLWSVVWALGAWLMLAGAVAAQCHPARVDLRGGFGTATFRVALADTPATRSKGLMFVREMPEDVGMLFVYSITRDASFWMKNTYIPLDMIFIDGRGVVHKVHENAVPHDERAIPSDGAVRAVLEINGGLARKLGIKPGSEVRHPALPQRRAAWPC